MELPEEIRLPVVWAISYQDSLLGLEVSI
jgi:hypothetical protein